jgi:hypothetical protein
MLQTSAPEYVDSDRPPERRDVKIAPLSRWGKPEHAEFIVRRDGTIADARQPQQLLHGQSHRDIKNPPTFVVDYPEPGQFIVRVGRVSASGLLRIHVDGELAGQRELPCGEGLGTSSRYQPQWKLWETTYDEDVAVDVPAGKHRIRVENIGRDWVTVTSYRFTGCRVVDKPGVLVAGMKSEAVAVLWLQNRRSTWYEHARGDVAPVGAFHVDLKGLADGTYEVQWWDTWKGAMKRAEQLRCRDRRLRLTVEELPTDVALKIRACD